MNGLYIEGLTAGYRNRMLWHDLTFSLVAGEISVLMGVNGSGKTTLLRTLQGQLKPASGRIIWRDGAGETNLANLGVRKRAQLLTTMAQEIPDIPGLTGSDLLEMGLYPKCGPFSTVTKADRDRVTALAKQYGAADLLTSFLTELSVGQRQILSLLRAIVQDTPVLLLDEPVSALDFAHGEMLMQVIHQMAKEGKAVLAVLHDPTMALRLGHRLLCLGDGQLFADIQNPDENLPKTEEMLRKLYPELRIHREPLFCYSEMRKDHIAE